jgi:hypothetical protein
LCSVWSDTLCNTSRIDEHVERAVVINNVLDSLRDT